MILLGIGAGIAFNPVLLAAMSDVEPQEAGLASGIVNTAFMMGGALGLAVLASIAASRTDSLSAGGDGPLAALVGGYHIAFLVGAIFALSGAAVGAGSCGVTPAAVHAEAAQRNKVPATRNFCILQVWRRSGYARCPRAVAQLARARRRAREPEAAGLACTTGTALER